MIKSIATSFLNIFSTHKHYFWQCQRLWWIRYEGSDG